MQHCFDLKWNGLCEISWLPTLLGNTANINAYHNRLKSWIARFRGVATKYLSNYLGWHRMLDAARQSMTPETFLAVSWD